MAGPLRGGGGVKGRPFKILLPFKNKNYFTLDNLSKYGHIAFKFVGRYFIWVATIFSKNRTILFQKLGAEKNPFPSILWQKIKVLWPLSPMKGGGP